MMLKETYYVFQNSMSLVRDVLMSGGLFGCEGALSAWELPSFFPVQLRSVYIAQCRREGSVSFSYKP